MISASVLATAVDHGAGLPEVFFEFGGQLKLKLENLDRERRRLKLTFEPEAGKKMSLVIECIRDSAGSQWGVLWGVASPPTKIATGRVLLTKKELEDLCGLGSPEARTIPLSGRPQRIMRHFLK